MKVDPLWPSFSDILKAYQACRVGKPASLQQTRFEVRLSQNILNLHHDLHARKYLPSKVSCFIVTHPKPREIFAADFRDRVVHHLIVSRLDPIWERKFSHNSFACRKGKGTHGALKCLQSQVKRISQGGTVPVYALQLDLAAFFVSIHRPTLTKLFLKHLNPRVDMLRYIIETYMNHDPRVNVRQVSSPEMHALIPREKSWFSRPSEFGLPIGNLTSQFGANVYLNDLDHWIERKIKPMGYLRYMDDLTLFHTDRTFLETLEAPIQNWLKQNRFMELNTKKTLLSNMRDGIDYLGYRILQVDNPQRPVELHSTPKRNWAFIADVRDLEKRGLPPMNHPHPLAIAPNMKNARSRLATINSRLGHLKHSKSYRFKKAAFDRLKKNTSIVDLKFEHTGEGEIKISRETWGPFKIAKDYSSITI